MSRRRGPLGVWFHRVVRAVRAFLRSLRLGVGQPQTAGTARTASRPNAWPRCVACHRHVARLCEQCGVCPACCDPDNHTDQEGEAP